MSIESVMPSNHLIFWHPLLLVPLIFPSIRVFSNESVLHIRWPKYWSFNLTLKKGSVQFSCSVISDSLQPHGLQHARIPCPSPFPGVYSNSCPLSQWCHPTISSSVVPFSSLLQSFPASESFPRSQFFASGAKVLKFQLQHQSFQWIFRTGQGLWVQQTWVWHKPSWRRSPLALPGAW